MPFVMKVQPYPPSMLFLTTRALQHQQVRDLATSDTWISHSWIPYLLYSALIITGTIFKCLFYNASYTTFFLLPSMICFFRRRRYSCFISTAGISCVTALSPPHSCNLYFKQQTGYVYYLHCYFHIIIVIIVIFSFIVSFPASNWLITSSYISM